MKWFSVFNKRGKPKGYVLPVARGTILAAVLIPLPNNCLAVVQRQPELMKNVEY